MIYICLYGELMDTFYKYVYKYEYIPYLLSEIKTNPLLFYYLLIIDVK